MPEPIPSRPGLCFTGPAMGRHPGMVKSQAELQAPLFAVAGHRVLVTSAVRDPLLRGADMAQVMLRRRHEYDVVIVAVYSGKGMAYAELTAQLGRRLGKVVVLVIHGGDVPTVERFRQRRVHRLLALADHVVCPSPYLFRFACGLGLPSSVILNTIETDLPFRPVTSIHGPRLFWMRTFKDLYNPTLAIRTLDLLRATHPDATLTMAGQDSGGLDECRKLAAELGVADRVTFPGFLDATAKREAFATHELYLHTNRADNSPASVIEALAAGLPVVGTRVGGMPDFVTDGRHALLVASDRPAQMADAVRLVIDDADLRNRLTTEGRALAEAHSWPVVCPQWEALFDRLLETRP
jgi:glycosyltransferase involved in cell wall biosynthesis